jgi:prevent-host-death family protein
MKTVNIHQAKTHLSRLLEAAASGEEVVIAKAGKPMARLVAYEPELKPRRLGVLKGKIKIHDDFDAPLPPDMAKAFGIDE